MKEKYQDILKMITHSNLQEESIEHLLNKTRTNLTMINQTKISGYIKNDHHFWTLNFIIMITKKCRRTTNLSVDNVLPQIICKWSY